MFFQALAVFLLLLLFVFINWKLWIKKLMFTSLDIVEETEAEKELDREIEELKLKRVEVEAMKDMVGVEKELAKLDKQIKKLQEMRDAIDF